jgi:hypothetical protein
MLLGFHPTLQLERCISSVDKNDSLANVDRLVDGAERVKLALITLTVHVQLLDVADSHFLKAHGIY